ncbi:MAG: DoxX family membrane protein [Deltaproteobacteria bacterium]|nr:DoxX family membrane protein [Deltaproteobacteria bacterium]
MQRAQAKHFLKLLLAGFMILVGAMHFARPGPFVKIVPDYLPSPLALVYVSGFFEILGGLGLLVARTTRAAAWGLVALYVAVFPANVNMALHQLPFGDAPVSPVMLWVRLPLQLVLIAWAWWYTRRP